MKKIWKYLSFCLPIMALAVGCSEAEGISEFQPDTNKTGNVTLLASIENADSRASLVATGEARWQANDAIKVICDDGSAAVFNIDGTGETRRALFTGTLEGKSVGEYALYPTSAELTNNNLSVELPAQITPSPTGTCSFMVGTINEKNEVLFKQLTAYATVQINKLAPETASIVFTSDKNLSGLHSVTLPEGMESGAAATAGDKSVSVVFTEAAPTMVNVFFALPVGEYSHLTATAYNAEGKKLNEVVLGSLISATRGLLLDYQIELAPKVAEKPKPIAGTVNVAGIYWALGNLQYEKDGATGNGFVKDWSISASQEFHFYIGVDGDMKGKQPDYGYDKVAHFNYGGIANPFNGLAADAASIDGSSNLDFSGKMYTDQGCQNETTDFAAAKYGDIAHWASCGQYRMPTAEEFETLYAKASRVTAKYNNVAGVYFYDPAYGEEPIVDDSVVKELTAEDLTVGLFLPYTGRGYKNTAESYIYKINSQGVYRTSTVNAVSTKDISYGIIYRIMKLTEGSYTDATPLNWGATARYAIRPVYVKGSASVTPPTPGPDPEPEPEPEPGVDPDPLPTNATVTVGGIEWATGNLIYEAGKTGNGFAEGYSISAQQFIFPYMEAADKTDLENFNYTCVFNYGGIENPFSCDATASAQKVTSEPAFDMSGKMYTDQGMVSETTDFAAAKFGDIAYWASKGAYRMPTAAEFKQLYDNSCRVKATYTTAEGVTVNGTYFYNPGAGESAGAVEADAPRVIKNADLAVGLFLPYTGRGYNKVSDAANDYAVNKIGSQGPYRTSTINLNSTLEATNAVIYRVDQITETEKNSKGLNGAFYNAAWDAKARFAIRPVKVK